MGIPLRRENQARRTGQKKTLCSAPQKTTPSGQQVVRRDRPLRNAQTEHSCANLQGLRGKLLHRLTLARPAAQPLYMNKVSLFAISAKSTVNPWNG
jgi:hypothetical protein